MRVLWLSHFLPYPPKGGALQRSHNLLAQAARRHRLTLVSLSQAAILPTREHVEAAKAALRPLADTIEVFDVPSDLARWKKLAAIASGFFGSAPYDVTWLRSHAMHAFLARLATEKTFDLIHLDTIGLWPYSRWFPGTPAVLNHHNVESQMMLRRARLARAPADRMYFRRQASSLRRLERTACPIARQNLVVSPLDASRLREVAPHCRTHVVSNGVDTAYFRPTAGRVPRPKTLIFAGRMSWYPNQQAARYFMRDIWPRLVQVDPEYRIAFVGKDPPDELRRVTDQRVVVTGFVDDIRPYLDQAEIVVCPIRNGGGTRLKVLDALAMAKPLVATSLAVEGIEIEAEEHYLLADTADDFVRQIQRLSGSPALQATLGRNGRRLVECRYAWSVIGTDLEAAYLESVSRTPTPSHAIAP